MVLNAFAYKYPPLFYLMPGWPIVFDFVIYFEFESCRDFFTFFPTFFFKLQTMFDVITMPLYFLFYDRDALPTEGYH